jgi:hypothetical protein
MSDADDRELRRRLYQDRIARAEKAVADAAEDVRSLAASTELTRSSGPVNLASRTARLAAAVATRDALLDAAPLID